MDSEIEYEGAELGDRVGRVGQGFEFLEQKVGSAWLAGWHGLGRLQRVRLGAGDHSCPGVTVQPPLRGRMCNRTGTQR